MENVFVKIDGIPGEAREKAHKDWIACKSWRGKLPGPWT